MFNKVMKIIDYKKKWGIPQDESALENLQIFYCHQELKDQILADLEKELPNFNYQVDLDKKIFLDECIRYTKIAIQATQNKNGPLVGYALKSMVFVSLHMKEYKMAMKCSNALAHYYLAANSLSEACEQFRELKDIALMYLDIVTAMYALK